MRRVEFAPGEYYHVFCRTLLFSRIFDDFKNSEHLMRSFWMANSDNSVAAFQFLRNKVLKQQTIDLNEILKIVREGKKLVDILCFSIMPDHYHLLLRENIENGISEFVRKCNISISKYYNIKNERKGPLFESRFNSKYVDTNEYLLHLATYIHLNPLDVLVNKSWRTHGLAKWSVARKELLKYPWSSAADFLRGTTKGNIILSGTDIILNQFRNEKEYEQFLKGWSLENFNILGGYI